jgi:ribonuclease VapC
MILDSSPLVAILAKEQDAELYIHCHQPRLALPYIRRQFYRTLDCARKSVPAEVLLQCDALFRRVGIVIEAGTADHAYIARQAFHDFGKGRHPAGLNYGDCFAYALAKHSGEPLLFKGNDFKKTDIVSAI